MDTFITALKHGLELMKVLKEFLQTTKEITNGMHETLMKITGEAASVAREEASIFREALRAAERSAEALMERYTMLGREFSELEQFTRRVAKSGSFTKVEIDQGNRMLRSILLRAEDIFKNYPVFKEKLQKAVDVGTRLAERCKVGAQDASTSASNTRIVGYSGSGVSGVGAAGALLALTYGFLTVATGGTAAAVMATGAAAASAYTRNRARQLDKLAEDFRTLEAKLDSDVARLNQVADRIEGRQEMTRVMVEELERHLKLAMQDVAITRAVTN